jgi:hypothetical protein
MQEIAVSLCFLVWKIPVQFKGRFKYASGLREVCTLIDLKEQKDINHQGPKSENQCWMLPVDEPLTHFAANTIFGSCSARYRSVYCIIVLSFKDNLSPFIPRNSKQHTTYNTECSLWRPPNFTCLYIGLYWVTFCNKTISNLNRHAETLFCLKHTLAEHTFTNFLSEITSSNGYTYARTC